MGQKTDSSKSRLQEKKEVKAAKKVATDTARPKKDTAQPGKTLKPVVKQTIQPPKTPVKDSIRNHTLSTLKKTKKPAAAAIQPLPLKDSSTKTSHADSLLKSARDSFIFCQKILANHPYFNFRTKAGYPPYIKKINNSDKDLYFYIITGLLLLFAVYKTVFDKYFSDLMHLFFRRSLKQRQLKQQVIQNSLPSLLLNVFFILIGGFYIAMVIQVFAINPGIPFWLLFLYCCAGLGIIYLGKFFLLKFVGWVFGISKLTDNYIFIIFLVNKIISILLIPLIIIITLSTRQMSIVAWTLSWVVIATLLTYRYLSAIGLIRRENSINFFHFLLYVFAFEILPTIMIYKGILSFLK